MNDFDYDLFEDMDVVGEMGDISSIYGDSYNTETSAGNLWYEDEQTDEVLQISELLQLCVEPTLRDGSSHVGVLLLWCFVFKTSTQIFEIPGALCHLISAGTGLMVLHNFFGYTMFCILGFTTGAYIVLYLVSHPRSIVKKKRGPITGILSVLFLIICEVWFVRESDWHKIRGAQMLIAMKVISVAFDLDCSALPNLPSLAEFLGYVLCVGTCVFGPWVSYRDYITIYKKPNWGAKWLWKMTISIIFAFLFLTISTCWVQWMIPDNAWTWWIAYRDALSFRSSHYFVSFMSETSALMAGFGHTEDLAIAKPQMIEIPRSLVQVVVYWNLPMHNWLKNYVFRTTRSLGSFTAILSTYAVSSLLHGLNFQLAAVLFSLGAYTYVEYVLRLKLSTVFKACIQARPCKKGCSHQLKEKQLSVVLVNICFGIITMFHLAYLGVMFDQTSKLQEDGYSYTHTLSNWYNLSYASHWVCFGTYMFYLLI